MTNLLVVVDGQFGSTGKGNVAGWLAATEAGPIAAVRVSGPNAGHTVIGDDGTVWKLRQLPTAAVTRPDADLYIAAGSEVDPEVLTAEVLALDGAGYEVSRRLFVDGMATLLDPQYKEQETAVGLTERIGSTGKGIGAARAARIMRTARVVKDAPNLLPHPVAPFQTSEILYDAAYETILIEAAQGYGLGLHTAYYPQVTSNDCRAIDALAMAGVSPWQFDELGRGRFEVYVCMRTHPIRVAGNSGPLLGETTWENLGLSPEYTTVTNKVRRVGMWDSNLAAEAVRANGGPPVARIALTMVDHEIPEIHGVRVLAGVDPELQKKIQELCLAVEQDAGAPVELITTGPDSVIRRLNGRH